MKIKLVDLVKNQELEKTDIKPLFNIKEIRVDLIKRVIKWQLDKARSGNHKVKTISEIRGTTAKPFKQKGTGNARQGSKRATQFRGGATVFGPVVRDHTTKLQKKIKKMGLINSIAHHVKNESLTIAQEPKLDKVSTKVLKKVFNDNEKSLVVYSKDTDQNFLNSIKNLKNVNILSSDGLNVYDIMNNDKVLFTTKALAAIEERLA
jgi:large subunit ribosomal protein L4